jgi:hypothetical protein
MQQDIFEVLRRMLPEAFAGPDIGKHSGGIFHWETVQNQRSLGEWPSTCFTRLGRGGSPTIVLRDEFIAAAKERALRAIRAADAPQTPRTSPPRPRAGRRSPRRRSDAAEAPSAE